jgi:hypothetical protein
VGRRDFFVKGFKATQDANISPFPLVSRDRQATFIGMALSHFNQYDMAADPLTINMTKI